MLGSIGLSLLFTALVPLPLGGIERTEVLNNASAIVARLNMTAGAREEVHSHPFSAVAIQLTPGDVEMTVGGRTTTEKAGTGQTWFIGKESPHAAANVGGASLEVITVVIKSGSGVAESGPAVPLPAGITRTPLLENAETRVVRVHFQPGAREALHSHPFDLLVIQLGRGRMEARVGSHESVADREPGQVLYLPKNVPHLVGNAGGTAFEVMSVALK